MPKPATSTRQSAGRGNASIARLPRRKPSCRLGSSCTKAGSRSATHPSDKRKTSSWRREPLMGLTCAKPSRLHRRATVRPGSGRRWPRFRRGMRAARLPTAQKRFPRGVRSRRIDVAIMGFGPGPGRPRNHHRSLRQAGGAALQRRRLSCLGGLGLRQRRVRVSRFRGRQAGGRPRHAG